LAKIGYHSYHKLPSSHLIKPIYIYIYIEREREREREGEGEGEGEGKVQMKTHFLLWTWGH